MGRFRKDRKSYLKTALVQPKKSQLLQQLDFNLTGNNHYNNNNYAVETSQVEEEEEEDELEDDDITATPKRQGMVQIAEQGVIKKRSIPLALRMKARLSLQMKRYSVFTSPEYRRRLHQELHVPKELDVTTSPIGLIRTVIDPTYRDREMGTVWEQAFDASTTSAAVTNGDESKIIASSSSSCSKDNVRQIMIEEADRNYQRDMRVGSYAIGSSKLRTSFNLRRSERLSNKRPRY